MTTPGGLENESPFEVWSPKRIKVTIADVINRIRQREQIDKTGINSEPLYATGEHSLLTEFQIAKGDIPVIVFTNKGKQYQVLQEVFGVHFNDLGPTMKPHYFADVRIVSPDQSEQGENELFKARIIFDSFLASDNEKQIVISEGLQKQLKAEEGQFLRIENIYPELSSINLDDRYYEK